MAQFLNDLLRDLVVLKKAYKPKRKQFDAANLDYHKQLLMAFRAEDEAKACQARARLWQLRQRHLHRA